MNRAPQQGSLSTRMGPPWLSTIGRLAALASVHPIAITAGEDLAHAFEFISLLRIRHQHEQIELGAEPDNFIDPRRLSSLEQRHLKKICRLIAQLLREIAERYGAGSRL